MVNNITQNDRQIARVEFWKSPVNFNGYKRQGNNIILYGLNSNENLSLVQHNKGLFLLIGSVFYCLQNTDEFESYIPEKDKQLIDELNAKIAQSQRDSRRNP